MKMETSKKILLVSYIAAISLTIVVIYGAFAGVDMSNVTQLALAAWAEVGATNIWYYKKAGRENVLKIVKKLPEKLREQVDINNILNKD